MSPMGRSGKVKLSSNSIKNFMLLNQSKSRLRKGKLDVSKFGNDE